MWYVVQRLVAPGDLLTVDGPLPFRVYVNVRPGDPVGFLPVFRTREEAEAVYGKGVPCAQIVRCTP